MLHLLFTQPSIHLNFLQHVLTDVCKCPFCPAANRRRQRAGRKPDPVTARIVREKKNRSYGQIAKQLMREEHERILARETEKGASIEDATKTANRICDSARLRQRVKQCLDAVRAHRCRERAKAARPAVREIDFKFTRRSKRGPGLPTIKRPAHIAMNRNP